VSIARTLATASVGRELRLVRRLGVGPCRPMRTVLLPWGKRRTGGSTDR
jgi:hypothetical protein